MKLPLWTRCFLAMALPLGVVAVNFRAQDNRAEATTAIPPAVAPMPADYVPVAKGSLTFNKDIAPIIFENCSTCHRPGEVAPFSLLTYQDVKKRSRQIAEVTGSGFMPPWKADEGKEKFLDAHRLSPAEIGQLRQWSNEGASEGKGTDLPPAPQFAAGWQNGTPDVVLQPEEAYHLDAEGGDAYRCFVIPTSYDTDRYVSAMEVRPGNRAVVHHVIAFLDTSGQAREKDAADPGPGYSSFGGIGIPPAGSLGGWAPGLVPHLAPTGSGILLPKAADIVLQVHYHKSGKPETDLTKIGLFFAKGPVDKRIRNLMVVSPRLRIPAGDADYITNGSATVPADITVLSVTPHMHWLGKEMKVTADLPDNTTEKLVNVNDYDFNWQMSYYFKNALKLPAGTRLDLTARYDNSADNPSNPSNPPHLVTWGEQTTDEMCIAFVNYTVDSEHLTKGEVVGALTRGLGERPNANRREMALKLFDAIGNGELDPDEKAAAMKWWLDRNKAN